MIKFYQRKKNLAIWAKVRSAVAFYPLLYDPKGNPALFEKGLEQSSEPRRNLLFFTILFTILRA
jgi:hypothetical protein